MLEAELECLLSSGPMKLNHENTGSEWNEFVLSAGRYNEDHQRSISYFLLCSPEQVLLQPQIVSKDSQP